MNTTAKKKIESPDELVCGLFSKKDASQIIASGTRHLHSSTLGERDTLAKISQDMIKSGNILTFPWESASNSEIEIMKSADRKKAIDAVIAASAPYARRDINEKICAVLEELLTNAIFHSYKRADNNPKYPRQLPASLDRREKIILKHSAQRSGIFLSVEDKGGNFGFDSIASAYRRCYGDAKQQVESKDGGAGLGLYMVFEMVTHFKVERVKGQSTVVSCWLNDTRTLDPDFFSFNFFERGGTNAK